MIVLEAGLFYRDMDTWAKQIRSEEGFKKISRVALILFKEEESYFRSHFLPVDCYVIKPMDLTEIGTITHSIREFAERISR